MIHQYRQVRRKRTLLIQISENAWRKGKPSPSATAPSSNSTSAPTNTKPETMSHNSRWNTPKSTKTTNKNNKNLPFTRRKPKGFCNGRINKNKKKKRSASSSRMRSRHWRERLLIIIRDWIGERLRSWRGERMSMPIIWCQCWMRVLPWPVWEWWGKMCREDAGWRVGM